MSDTSAVRRMEKTEIARKGVIPLLTLPPDIAELKAHPEADIFPMADEHASAGLRESIRKHGIKAEEPIILTRVGVPEGKFQIADGRNRHAAAAAVAIEWKLADFREFVGTFDELVEFIGQRNLRRHMDGKAKEAYAKRLIDRYPGWPTRRLAALAGVSHTTIANLRKPKEEDPTYKALLGAWQKASEEAQARFVEFYKIDLAEMLKPL